LLGEQPCDDDDAGVSTHCSAHGDAKAERTLARSTRWRDMAIIMLALGALSSLAYVIVSVCLSVLVEHFGWLESLSGITHTLLNRAHIGGYLFGAICLLAALSVNGIYVLASLAFMAVILALVAFADWGLWRVCCS
jgi:hypothetical protein